MAAALSSSDNDAPAINIKEFNSEQDDFERWVKRFEKAVKLSTTRRDDLSLHELYKEWLPLKLDDAANTFLEQLDTATLEWPAIKSRMEDLLIDPHQKLKWRTKQTTIKWDGKESIHMLKARVVRDVNKYDKHMPQEVKDEEYFVRFRAAFRKTLRRVIDMNCAEERRTIDFAKDAIMRYLMTGDDKDEERTGSFCGASLDPDRLSTVEDSLAAVSEQLEDITISLRAQNDRIWDVERRLGFLEDKVNGHGRSRDHYPLRHHEFESRSMPDHGRSNGTHLASRPRRSYTRRRDHSPSQSSSEEDEIDIRSRRHSREKDKSPSPCSSSDDETYQHFSTSRRNHREDKNSRTGRKSHR